MEWVKCCMESVERHVEKPWAKIACQYHEGPGGPLHNKISLDSSIFAVTRLGETGNVVVGCVDGRVLVLNIESGDSVHTLEEQKDSVSCLSVSIDGKLIVSGSRDKKMRRSDGESGASMGEPLQGHDGAVKSVVVSGEGRVIASRSADCTVRKWDG